MGGVLGLIQAAERFDVADGASFATFARYRIRGRFARMRVAR